MVLWVASLFRIPNRFCSYPGILPEMPFSNGSAWDLYIQSPHHSCDIGPTICIGETDLPGLQSGSTSGLFPLASGHASRDTTRNRRSNVRIGYGNPWIRIDLVCLEPDQKSGKETSRGGLRASSTGSRPTSRKVEAATPEHQSRVETFPEPLNQGYIEATHEPRRPVSLCASDRSMLPICLQHRK